MNRLKVATVNGDLSVRFVDRKICQCEERFLLHVRLTLHSGALFRVADHPAKACTLRWVSKETVHKKTLRGRTKGFVIGSLHVLCDSCRGLPACNNLNLLLIRCDWV